MPNYKVTRSETTKIHAFVKTALKCGVKIGALEQAKGTGATGSFKLGKKKVGEKLKKVKKPKAAAKPRKAASPKKAKAALKKKATPKKVKAPANPKPRYQEGRLVSIQEDSAKANKGQDHQEGEPKSPL